MASTVAARRTEHPAALAWPVRPPEGVPPAGWDLMTDGADALWWHWLGVAPGTSPAQLERCWYRVDDLGMGLGLYAPRRLGVPDGSIDAELLNVGRLIDLEGWPRRKTARRLSAGPAARKAVARDRLESGGERLAAAGVLPWAACPAARFPRAGGSRPTARTRS